MVTTLSLYLAVMRFVKHSPTESHGVDRRERFPGEAFVW
jgi:hypothetical protein